MGEGLMERREWVRDPLSQFSVPPSTFNGAIVRCQSFQAIWDGGVVSNPRGKDLMITHPNRLLIWALRTAMLSSHLRCIPWGRSSVPCTAGCGFLNPFLTPCL